MRQAAFNPFADFAEKAVFKIDDPFLRAENFGLEFLQFLRDISFGVDKRLLANVISGNAARATFADFDIVAENAIVADLERANSGARFFFLLKILQKSAVIGGKAAQIVQIFIVIIFYNSALAHIQGGVFAYGFFDKFGFGGKISQPVAAGD